MPEILAVGEESAIGRQLRTEQAPASSTEVVQDLLPMTVREMEVRETLQNEAGKRTEFILALRQDVLVVSIDRMQLYLLKYEGAVRAKDSWQAPLGILVSLGAALLTAEFKSEFFGLPGTTWQAVFVVAALFCSGLVLFKGARAYKARRYSAAAIITLLKEDK